MIDRRRYEWRQMLGSSQDEVLSPPNIDENVALFSMQYADFSVLIGCKYLCKYLYRVYCHRRRFETAKLSNFYSKHKIVRFTGVKFWCDIHERFYCYHEKKESQIQTVGVASSCHFSDLHVFRKLISQLTEAQLSLLKKIVSGRSFFEILSSVVFFFYSFRKD